MAHKTSLLDSSKAKLSPRLLVLGGVRPSKFSLTLGRQMELVFFFLCLYFFFKSHLVLSRSAKALVEPD